MQKLSAKPSERPLPPPRSPGELIRRCAELANLHSQGRFDSSATKILEKQISYLSIIWQVQATLAAASLPNELEAVAKDEHPGYVFISNGSGSYAIPCFLIDLFPIGPVLSELNELCRSIRVAADSVVCLSGSGCSLGAGVPVADVDFCEYLKNIDTTVADRLVSAARTKRKNVACFKVTLNDTTQWKLPWPSILSKPTQKFLDSTTEQLKNSNRRKIDYVANAGSLGVLEVTNKLLSIDYAYGEVGEAKGSFSFQEVPLATDTWTPRNLSDPIEVGRYVNWLFDSVREYLLMSVDNPRFAVKALRRAIPLARITLATNEISQLNEMLINTNGARLAALHDRCELYNRLMKSNESSLLDFLPGLEKSINALRDNSLVDCAYSSLTESENDEFNCFSSSVRESMENIVGSIENLIKFS